MVGFIAVRCLFAIADVVSKVQDMRAETLVVEGGVSEKLCLWVDET